MNDSIDETDLSRRFVEETGDVPEPAAHDPQGPGLVPFLSALRLTLEQEELMIEHAFRRKDEIAEELGRELTKGSGWISGEAADAAVLEKSRRSHYGKRELFELSYNNNVEWRRTILGPEDDNIFSVSNLTAPISRRIVRQMVARANNYYFGTDPWIAAYPVGTGDGEIAEKADKFGKFKLEQAGAKHVLEMAIEMAFVRGESVVKVTYDRKENIYTIDARVLVDGEGNPLKAMDGDYILEQDLWVEGMVSEIDAITHERGPLVPSGKMVLKRDGKTPQPEGMIFAEKSVPRRITTYAGPRLDLKYFKDFLCPLNASSIQEADCVVDLYDMPVSDLVDTYMRQALDAQEADADGGASKTKRPDVERLVSVVREIANSNSEPKSALDQPKDSESNYQNTGTLSGLGPNAGIAEFHFRFDANGDGIYEEIFLVADVASRRPLFYDHEANMTPDGERPYALVRINEVDGRWYGVGAMEMFETYQENIDLILNRWNVSQTQAGRVTTFDPSACWEGDSTDDLKLTRGDTYTLKQGKTIDDLVQTKTLIDVKFDHLKEQMEFFLQMAMNESGVQHANDAQMVGLDQAKLATGIRNIEKSGQEMFSIYISHIEPGAKLAVRKFFKLLFARMDDSETFQFFEGKVGTELTLTAEEVADLDMNVTLEMTRYRGEQQLQSNLQAATHVTQFFSFPPEIQVRVAPFYIQILKALQIQDADEIIVPVTAMIVPPPGTAAQGAMPAPPPAPNL